MLEEHENINIGSRLLALRETSNLSQRELTMLSSVSEPTISRMENGAKSFEFQNLEKIARVFGYQIEGLVSKNFEVPTESQLRDAIKKHIKVNKLDVDFKMLFKKKRGTAYYVDKIMETDFLNKPKEMKEIVEYCKHEYSVVLKGDDIGNILKRREEKQQIKRRPIKGTNRFYYQKV